MSPLITISTPRNEKNIELKPTFHQDSSKTNKNQPYKSRRESFPLEIDPTSARGSHIKAKPMTIQVSRIVQVLTTPRGDSHGHKSIGFQNTSKALDLNKKKNPKMEAKTSKETKSRKMEVQTSNINFDRDKKKREDKVVEFVEDLEKAFNNLKKTVLENKSKVSEKENHIKVLQILKTCMNDTQSVLQSLKLE